MPTIRYTLSMPQPQTHLFHVKVEVDDISEPHVDLVMPAWTPGAYAVRDFARNVQDFAAGKFSWSKVDKSRWRIKTNGASRVEATYHVWAFELEVDRSHLDETHGYFNGASVFMYVDGAKLLPATLDIKPYRGWKVVTGLPRISPTRFRAPNYDELIDCPTDIGTAPVQKFKVAGKEHRVLIHGVQNWDHDRVTADTKRIVEEAARLFRGLPYKDYTFLFFATSGPALGGLEHRNSTAITLNPWIGKPFKSYERLLEVTSHEFFHLWNVKRIHPKVLGPFDYEKETYTKLLWVMEGITSYYDDLICERAKLYPNGRYLKKVAETIEKYREKPSRLRQSLTASSFDTWLWRYEGDGNSINRMMSYYEKGSLVGMCLDLEIRHRTGNKKSLDDVMRHCWEKVARLGGTLDEDDFQPIVEKIAGGSYREFFDRYVDGVREIPFEKYLSYAGLDLVKEPPSGDDAKDEPSQLAWLGVTTRPAGDRPAVASVTENSPAWRDGLSTGDELVAFDGARLTADNLSALLKDRKPGDKVAITVFRGPRMVEVAVKLGKRDNVTLGLKSAAKAGALEKAIHQAWLKRPWKKAAKKK